MLTTVPPANLNEITSKIQNVSVKTCSYVLHVFGIIFILHTFWEINGHGMMLESSTSRKLRALANFEPHYQPVKLCLKLKANRYPAAINYVL